jgi:ATP-binding cassette subfamily G (WHITE) protein 2 (PDR)
MYRLSPFTYVVGGMIPTGISMAPIVCSPQELIKFNPPSNRTCGEYMAPYIEMAGGYLVDPESMSGCEYCSASTTDELLKQFGLSYGTRWRDFGLLWAYVIFNIVVAVGLYWLVRVVSSFHVACCRS